jgi:membrane associated rhomboid family serine protease
VLYPRVRVHCLVFLGFFITTVTLPAWTMLLYWLGLQFVSGLFGLLSSEGGGVAFWAHVGGFVAGMALVKVFANPEMVREHREGDWQPRRVGARW